MPESVPLPHPPPAAARRGALVDAVLVGLVLLFALAAGSFAARNSDLWLHLAAGRLVASGDYRFGTDPFASTTADRYWANHAWLFDLGLYLTFHNFGAAAVVALKAVAVAATAGVMLRTARGPAWLAAGCVLLAVLAMAPRLLLQPACASYLLLAACVYCLQAGGKALRAVPALVVLWVNVDGWFLLGPLLVGLFALGRRLDPAKLTAWPRWFVPATLAACLLSPHHVRALTLPPELSPAVWASGFPSDPRLAGYFASPWQLAPLGAAGGYNLAAGAFFALLGLGVLSFARNRRALRTWRGPVWLTFALLAAWQVRLVPFFAVVAGPIAAFNLGEVIPAAGFARPGRVLAFLAGGVLVGLGWYGKLTGFHNPDRGAAWGVHTDPTLERTAAVVAEWQHSRPADARVFTAHPDVGHYLAWYAPGERSFIDARLNLFTEVAGDYRELSAALGLLPGGDGAEPFAARGIGAVVVYDPDPRRMTGALHELNSARWDIVRVTGGAVLAVPKAGPSVGSRFDPERGAFGPASDLTPADAGPATLAGPVPLWEVRRSTARRGSWEADAGTVYLRLFEDAADRSPALPLLALRAGRRGAELDPADATAWLVAGRAALVLDSRTWERDVGDTLSPLAFVRHVAAAGALVQAARLAPDSAAAHEALAGVYARRGFFDLTHRHAAAAHRLVTRAGDAGERVDRAAEQMEAAERLMQDAENRFLVRTAGQAGDPFARARTAAELGLPHKAIEVLLASHPDLYGGAGLGLLADLLLQVGYAPEARTLLDREELRLNPAAFGLFTLPGRSAPGGPAWAYRLPAYDWYDLCQCVAAGRYPGATVAIDRIRDHLAAEERQFGPPATAALAALVGRAAGYGGGLAGRGGVGGVPAVVHSVREGQRVSAFLAQTRFLSVARADLGVLAGVLELERGNPAGAALRFTDALALYTPARGAAPNLPGEALAKRYLEQIARHR